MWIRPVEMTPSQNYTLYSKVNALGWPTPYFRFYFATDNSFIVEMNSTAFLTIENAYNSSTFPEEWIYVGVSLSTLLYDTMNDVYKTKISAYIYGPLDS